MRQKNEKTTTLKNNKFTEFEVLTPNDTIENKAENALKFSLENKKIKNIAITGQYSSGKSSIIQSYFSKYVNEKEYLNISLATFEKKEELPIEESRSLEKIIIEKLYYSVLRKYNVQRDFLSSVITIVVTMFVNVGIYLFNIESINNSFKNNFFLTLTFIILEIVCLVSLIAYSVSYIINLQKLKLKIGDVEVEVNHNSDEEKTRNLLNEELDFIVKTMNIAGYKYIVFEDLDRFQNPKIFERLRDLNITLNSTLKQKIKFIYAIRDEIFIADNRTKFFDFIIPVVPYVSYENSGEKLLKIIQDHVLENELSEDFILDISLYISDIRILKNTVNEYIIYKKTLDKIPPSYENLFSILLYKNTCSEDFANLQKREGEIYNCFLKKNEKISEEINKIKEEIKNKEKQYSEVQKYIMSKNNIKELVVYMIKTKVNNNNNITLKNVNYNDIIIQYGMNVDKIADEIVFSENTKIEYLDNGRLKTDNLLEFFKEKLPNFFKQYEDYKKGIDKIKEEINCEIEKLYQEIDKAKEYTLSELLQKNSEMVKIDLGNYSELIKYLLINSYIDENYNIYINKFHEGSITEKDYNFIMNIKNGKENDYKAKLDNSIKIIKRLKKTEFKKEEILNINILDTLLERQDYIEERDIFFNTLMKSSRYVEIIKNCICGIVEFKNKKTLIINLCYFDKNILKKVQETQIDPKKRNLIFENIFIEIESSDLKGLNGIEILIKEIENNNLLKDTNLNDVKNKILEFKLKYYNISEVKNNIKLYQYIIENNSYQINYENVFEILIDNEKANKNDIREKNYESISNNERLKKYIDTNIQYYIDNVYCQLEDYQKDSSIVIKELLNNSNIKIESKEIIVNKESNQINNISEIEDSRLWKTIFDNNLIRITWDNINDYYNIFGIDESLIKIFNDEDKRKKILLDNMLIENKSNIKFLKELLLSNDLTENTYDLIINMSECKIEDVVIDKLNKNRLLKLINNKRIAFNVEMLKNIREYSTDMLIAFIRNNYNGMHREIDNNTIIFNLNEINEILKSDVTPTIKGKCISMISDEEIENISMDLSENIASISVENKFNDKLDESILLKIVSDVQDIDLKVKLINLNFNVLNKNNIMEYLAYLGTSYSKIIVNRTTPKIINNEHNKLLLENIRKLEYKIKYDINKEYIILRKTNR